MQGSTATELWEKVKEIELDAVSAWEAVSILREAHMHTPLLEDLAKLMWRVT